MPRLLTLPFFVLAAVLAASAAPAGDTAAAFRAQNGLVPYSPPAWFLKGYFMAREKQPAFLFGPVESFVKGLKAKTVWLIEDLEIARKDKPNRYGKPSEYTIYLEAAAPSGPQYWVFVVMPHETAQDWFNARRAYHGSKAGPYYGQTTQSLAKAASAGVKFTGELRFFVQNGQTSLVAPEDLIQSRLKMKPVYDLSAGRRVSP